MDIRSPVPTIYGEWPELFGEAWKNQVEVLRHRFGGDIEKVLMPGAFPTDVPIVYVSKKALIDLVRFIKEEAGFEYGFLADITATDEYPAENRFEIIYNLFSHTKFWRIRIKVATRENEEVPSLVSIWPGADWAEREVYDMFGVRFTDHPNMSRILMDNRWEGHPLRKDYPIKKYQVFPTPQEVNMDLLK